MSRDDVTKRQPNTIHADRRPIGTSSVSARPTRQSDLDWVVALESRPENARFVLQWPRDRHRAALADRSIAHWVVCEHDEPVGYMILAQVRIGAASVELVRLVIGPKGRGLGRAALEIARRFVFERLGAHRLWLDVFENNERARRLYRAAGFQEEGTLREAVERDGRYASLVVYSQLAGEAVEVPS